MQHCKREYCNAGTRQWSQRGIYIRKASKAKNSEQIIIRSNDSRYRGYPKTEKNAIQQRGVVTIQEAVTGFLAEKENTIKLSSYLRYEQMLRKHTETINGVVYNKYSGSGWNIAYGSNASNIAATGTYSTNVTLTDGMIIVFDFSPYCIYEVQSNS